MAKPKNLRAMNLSITNAAGDFVPLREIKLPKLDRTIEFTGQFDASDDFLATMTNLADEQAKVHAARLQAETDRWCWKAIARGVGNRVWRSNPIVDHDTFVMRYQFQILAPGQPAPGSGMVFGPFSQP